MAGELATHFAPLRGIEIDDSGGQHVSGTDDADAHRLDFANDFIEVLASLHELGPLSAPLTAGRKAADLLARPVVNLLQPGLLDRVSLDRFLGARRQTFQDVAGLRSEIVAPVPSIRREIERVTLAKDVHFARFRAVKREFTLQAMISLSGIVVGLEVGRITEERANIHLE